MRILLEGDTFTFDGQEIFEDRTDDIRTYLQAASLAFDALCEFVERVEDGEIKSRTTYKKFKEILALIEVKAE